MSISTCRLPLFHPTPNSYQISSKGHVSAIPTLLNPMVNYYFSSDLTYQQHLEQWITPSSLKCSLPLILQTQTFLLFHLPQDYSVSVFFVGSSSSF